MRFGYWAIFDLSAGIFVIVRHVAKNGLQACAHAFDSRPKTPKNTSSCKNRNVYLLC